MPDQSDTPGLIVWAIRYSNGWQFTDSFESAVEAEGRDLRVLAFTRQCPKCEGGGVTYTNPEGPGPDEITCETCGGTGVTE